MTPSTRLLHGIHVQNGHVDRSVAGDAVGPLILLLLLDQVIEVVALAEALVDVIVTLPARGGDVLEADGAPRGLASGDFFPVCPLLVANLGVPAVAMLTTHAFLTVNGYLNPGNSRRVSWR